RTAQPRRRGDPPAGRRASRPRIRAVARPLRAWYRSFVYLEELDREGPPMLPADLVCYEPARPSPERDLAAGVLLQALMDIKTDQDAQDAWDWLLAEGRYNGAGGWSFDEVCEILDFDPDRTRRAIITKRFIGTVKRNRRCR